MPVNLLFGSSTFGKRRDGRKALLSIVQVGSAGESDCQANPNLDSLLYTKEVVKIIP